MGSEPTALEWILVQAWVRGENDLGDDGAG